MQHTSTSPPAASSDPYPHYQYHYHPLTHHTPPRLLPIHHHPRNTTLPTSSLLLINVDVRYPRSRKHLIRPNRDLPLHVYHHPIYPQLSHPLSPQPSRPPTPTNHEPIVTEPSLAPIIPIPSDLPRDASRADLETRTLISRFLRRQPVRLRRIAEIALRYDHGKEFFPDAIPYELEGILPNITYTTRIRTLNHVLSHFRTLSDYRPSSAPSVPPSIGPNGFVAPGSNPTNGTSTSTSSMGSGGGGPNPAVVSGVVFFGNRGGGGALRTVVQELRRWEQEDKPLRLVYRTHRPQDVFGGIAFKPVQPPWTITIEQREPSEAELALREEEEARPGSAPETRDSNGAVYLPRYEPGEPGLSSNPSLQSSPSTSSLRTAAMPSPSPSSTSLVRTPSSFTSTSTVDDDDVVIVSPYLQSLGPQPPQYGEVRRARRRERREGVLGRLARRNTPAAGGDSGVEIEMGRRGPPRYEEAVRE
ncbi:hypothetical protein BC829DRAFT_444131 [Chytridium lagenaria]|nr:hypothetical protein BC829DRAFT_444131 [Chytridium lagenaria]